MHFRGVCTCACRKTQTRHERMGIGGSRHREGDPSSVSNPSPPPASHFQRVLAKEATSHSCASNLAGWELTGKENHVPTSLSLPRTADKGVGWAHAESEGEKQGWVWGCREMAQAVYMCTKGLLRAHPVDVRIREGRSIFTLKKGRKTGGKMTQETLK